MTEVEQCVVVINPGCPAVVRHKRSCTSDYCDGDYLAERANRARVRRIEMELESKDV